MKALIIGGGIAGPVAALALQQRGIDARVFEARSSDATDPGAWLTFAGNGVSGLRMLGVADRIEAAGFATTEIVLANGAGRALGRTPLGMPSADGAVSISIRRADLSAGLHAAASDRGIEVTHGRVLVALEQDGPRVTAVFADGSRETGDVLIGADGVHSVVRRLLDPEAPSPRYVPLLNSGGYAPGGSPEVPAGQMAMTFGAHGFFGTTAAPDGSVWWFANWEHRVEPSRDELRALDDRAVRGILADAFRTDVHAARPLIDATPDPLGAWATYDLPDVPVWHRGRAGIIGDAAHAVAPSSGQGASMAIEDAIVLAGCLAGIDDVPSAFAEFERRRRARVQRVVRWGARSTNSKVAGPVGAAIRDAMMPAIMKLAGRARDEWLYRYDLVAESRVTRGRSGVGSPVPDTGSR